MEPATVAALIDAAARHWTLADGIEITMEANPNSAEAARFADVASCGRQPPRSACRRSMTPRSFLGRAHDVGEGLAALDAAQNAVDRVSIDLIYAWPDQSADDWEAELSQALAFGTEHLSLYQLTIEPGTRFETDVRLGAMTPADPDHAATLYELTQAMTSAAGRPAYEVSNHAAPGAESRHNLAYWRYADYAGVGPGAHGRRGASPPRATRSRRTGSPHWHAIATACRRSALLPGGTRGEALMMGLRLAEGVDLAEIAARDRALRRVRWSMRSPSRASPPTAAELPWQPPRRHAAMACCCSTASWARSWRFSGVEFPVLRHSRERGIQAAMTQCRILDFGFRRNDDARIGDGPQLRLSTARSNRVNPCVASYRSLRFCCSTPATWWSRATLGCHVRMSKERRSSPGPLTLSPDTDCKLTRPSPSKAGRTAPRLSSFGTRHFSTRVQAPRRTAARNTGGAGYVLTAQPSDPAGFQMRRKEQRRTTPRRLLYCYLGYSPVRPIATDGLADCILAHPLRPH